MTDIFAADLDSTTPVIPRPDANLDILSGVSLRVSVEVGSTSMRLADLLNVAEGSVIELDRQSNDLLDMFANGSLIARGEIVSVDNRYGIRIAEVLAPEQRTASVERRL
jgi:flagellar motor switch protein FliN